SLLSAVRWRSLLVAVVLIRSTRDAWRRPGRSVEVGFLASIKVSSNRSKGATMTTKLIALVSLFLMTGTAMAQEPKVTPLMSKDLAEYPGKEALMITVEHVPGRAGHTQAHNTHTIGYGREGPARVLLKGGEQWTLATGQSFYEAPSDVHLVDRNASSTTPAKFLVLLIKDKGAPAVVPVQ